MEYTGIQNVYLNGTMLGFTKEEIDAKMENILQFADIGEFINQPVKTYSSGMFVRLAFAVAINVEPEILIVDEALSVGDVFFQAKCYHKFEEYKQMGKTLIFVSHDLSSINKYCDRVILLNKGHMLAQGKPKEMIDMYKKLLVNQLESDTLANEDPNQKKIMDESLWKSQLNCNPKLVEYGEKQGEIYDFAIIDEMGNITNLVEKGSECSFKMRVISHEDIHDPIFAVTIKDLKGTDITGTNTMYEGQNIPLFKKGERLEIEFRQPIDLQGGDYVISFGFTGYKDGEFCVYHRLYDACNLTVISDKDTVGFYDTNSMVTIKQKGSK
jgi:teichoic acid transport system ATP-binding protein